MNVKVKKLNPTAQINNYAKPGDAGIDLTAVSLKYDEALGTITYGTGLAFEIPEGYVGLLFPRSSICKKSMVLCNSVGVVDSSYRGEVMFKFHVGDKTNIYNVGDKVGQIIIMPFPQITLEESDTLTATERGEGGFGHTGI